MNCCNCNKECDDSFVFKDEYYCEDCFHESFIFCESCDEIIPIDYSYLTTNGVYQCNECFFEDYAICDNCGKTLHRDDAHYDPSDAPYCSLCFYEYYVYCAYCDGIVSLDDAIYCERCDSYYHDRCACSCYEDEEDGLHDHEYKPKFVFYGREYPYYGLEIETDNFKTRSEAVRQLKEICDGSYYLKYDGSLNNGIEIVTHPMSINYLMNFRDLLSKIRKIVLSNGGTSFKAGTCGIHIHRSSDDVSEVLQTKLIWLFNMCQSNFVKLAQRRSEDFASFYMGQDLDFKTTFKRIKGKDHAVRRYQAINFINKNTIEFRIFKGSLKIETIYAYLGFVHYITNFTKELLVNHVSFTDKEELWSDFVGYVEDRLRKEPLARYLFAYIGNKSLIPKKYSFRFTQNGKGE